MTLAAGCFTPSEDFLKYMLGQVQEHAELEGPMARVAKLAQNVVDRLERTLQRGARNKPPSRYEVETVTQGGILLCRVFMQDDSKRTIVMDSSCTVAELIKEIFQKTRVAVDEQRAFSIYVHCLQLLGEVPLALKPSEMICDVLYNCEKHAKPKRFRGELEWLFSFRRRLFTPLGNMDMVDPVTLNLLFHQGVRSVSEGQHPVSDEVAMDLAAYQLQAEFGDGDHLFVEAQRSKYFPKRVLAQHPKFDELEFLLLPRSAKLKGMSRQDVQKSYLKILHSWKFYGSHMWPVKRKEKPNSVLLAINYRGIHVLRHGALTELESYPALSVVSWTPVPKKSFHVSTGNMMQSKEHIFFTEDSVEIEALWQEYVDVIVQRRQKKKRQAMARRALHRQNHS
jgi:FERM central domain/RA like domain/MyTH4 domain/PTB domain (IRS-1 type)